MSEGLTLEEKRKKYGIGIWTVLDFLKIEIPENTSDFYIRCANCSGDDYNRETLNINIEKEVFNCPRCNVSGGYLKLFSLYYHGKIIPGYTRKDMISDLKKANFDYDKIKKSNRNFENFKTTPKVPILDIQDRDFAYRQFLNELKLEHEDLEDLRRRGLTDKAISMLGYKSVPNSKIPSINLAQKGVNLKGVPGFYRNQKTLEWSFIGIEGYLIPYKNVSGMIEGAQIRTKLKGSKYIWASSKSKRDGSGAKTWPHFAQTFTVKRKDYFLLTEGGLKGDIINFFTGIDVVAIPGVNALTQLEPMILELKNRGYKRVFTAFDMDFLSNEHVKRAYDNLLDFLKPHFDISILEWDPNYNGVDTDGLDDYLNELNKEIYMFKDREQFL